jgi:hypothetical protein
MKAMFQKKKARCKLTFDQTAPTVGGHGPDALICHEADFVQFCV